MQRLGLNQSLQQKLSPQQIQFIKLLQVPTAELGARVEEELELNPVLEEGSSEDNESETPETQETPETPETQDDSDNQEEPTSSAEEDIDLKDYLRDDDYSGYKTYDGDDEEDKEMPIATSSSLQETLITQLGFLGLGDHK